MVECVVSFTFAILLLTNPLPCLFFFIFVPCPACYNRVQPDDALRLQTLMVEFVVLSTFAIL